MEAGQGLGAAYRTGWTGLVANLLLMKQRLISPVNLRFCLQ